jgi:RNA-binding protein
MISSKQRAYLRSLAHELEPKLHIGKAILNENVIKQANDYLEVHELMKVTVQKYVEKDVSEIANELATAINAEIVQVIGRKFSIYKMNKKEPKIQLPK